MLKRKKNTPPASEVEKTKIKKQHKNQEIHFYGLDTKEVSDLAYSFFLYQDNELEMYNKHHGQSMKCYIERLFDPIRELWIKCRPDLNKFSNFEEFLESDIDHEIANPIVRTYMANWKALVQKMRHFMQDKIDKFKSLHKRSGKSKLLSAWLHYIDVLISFADLFQESNVPSKTRDGLFKRTKKYQQKLTSYREKLFQAWKTILLYSSNELLTQFVQRIENKEKEEEEEDKPTLKKPIWKSTQRSDKVGKQEKEKPILKSTQKSDTAKKQEKKKPIVKSKQKSDTAKKQEKKKPILKSKQKSDTTKKQEEEETSSEGDDDAIYILLGLTPNKDTEKQSKKSTQPINKKK